MPFEFKRDHAHFFELHLENEPRVHVDNREVVWAEFVPETELAGRPLIPHVRSYLTVRAGLDDGTTPRDD